MKLPPTMLNAYLVRTWFGGSDLAWCGLVDILRTPTNDGYLAGIDPISDPRFEGSSPEQVRAAVVRQTGMVILTVADHMTLTTPDWPVLVLPLLHPAIDRPFRATAQALPIVEMNLWLGNVGWDDLERDTDSAGVFRGFA